MVEKQAAFLDFGNDYVLKCSLKAPGMAACCIIDKNTEQVLVHALIRATSEIKGINSEYLEGKTRQTALCE